MGAINDTLGIPMLRWVLGSQKITVLSGWHLPTDKQGDEEKTCQIKGGWMDKIEQKTMTLVLIKYICLRESETFAYELEIIWGFVLVLIKVNYGSVWWSQGLWKWIWSGKTWSAWRLQLTLRWQSEQTTKAGRAGMQLSDWAHVSHAVSWVFTPALQGKILTHVEWWWAHINLRFS